VTGRKELIERLLAGHYDGPERSGPPPGITLAGVEITNPAAIEKHARMRLEKRLPDVEAFKTFEDFGHLGAECCGSCHGSYEICEMEAVPLPGGGHAWVCCAVDRAIRPEWHAEQHRLFLESGRGKKLRKMYHEIYGGDEKTSWIMTISRMRCTGTCSAREGLPLPFSPELGYRRPA
jgi:hypothetical protein